MSDVLGTAVLELSTDKAKLISDLAAVKAELKGVADTAAATGQAAASDWATMAQAITAVSRQLADQKVKQQELKEHTSELGSTFTELKGTLSELAGAFGVAFSIDYAVDFLKSVAEEADALKNLSLQTQISIDDLQILGGATREYGVSTEELGRALFQLKQRIAGGDDSVATAYHLMGMSLEQIKDMDPVTLFLETERGLGRLQGNLRDTAAADLFGGRLGSSLLALSTGIDDAIDKSKQMNRASEESVKAAAEYASAIDRASHSVHSWVMEIEGGVALGFNVLTDAADKGATKWQIFKAMFIDWTNSGVRVGASTSALTALLDGLNRKTEQNTDVIDANQAAARRLLASHQAVTTALDAEAQAAVFMEALRSDAIKPLLDFQAKDLAQLKELGELNAKNAAAIGVTAAQYDAYVAAQERKKEADRLAAEEAKKAHEQEQQAILETTRLWDEYTQLVITQSGTSTQAQMAAIDRWAADLTAKVQKAGADTAEFYDALYALIDQKQQGVLINWTTIAAQSSETWKQNLQETAEKAAATYQFMVDHAERFRADTITKFGDVAAQAQIAADNWYTSWNDHLDQLDQHIADTDQKVKEAADAAAAVASTVESQFSLHGNDMAAKAAAAGGSVAHDDYGNPYVYIPGVNAPGHRASGGPVAAGMPYIVNERGAGTETFVPSTNGYIVPNGGVGGGVHVQITINGSVLSDERKIAEAVRSALETKLRSTGARIAN